MSVRARSSFIDITPRTSCSLAGDRFRTDPFTGIHSPLEINAIFFEDARSSLMLLAVDALYAGAAFKLHVQQEAAAVLGLSPSQVVICASHTHFAPMLDEKKKQLGEVSPDYFPFVCKQASTLIRQVAEKRPQVITARMAIAQSNHAVNRRRHWPYPVLTRSGPRLGAIVMAPSPSHYSDTSVRSLWFYGEDGNLMTAIWNYACHPVCLPLERMVSSEFPGRVRSAVRVGRGDLPVLFLQGFCGDVRPNIKPRADIRTWVKTLLVGPRFGDFTLEGWENWAGGIAQIVLTGEGTGRPVSLTDIALRENCFPVGEIFSGKVDPSNIEFHGVSLGPDLQFLTVSAEPVAEWVQMLKQGVVPVGYEGDVFGYLPTDTMIRQGGYEGGQFAALFHGEGRMTPNVNDNFAQAVFACGMLANQSVPADAS